MITSIAAYALCFLAIPILYNTLTPRNATITAYLVFYLTMPSVSFDVPGLPDLTKSSAIALACWLGTILFASDRLLSFRPRWFDIPAALYLISPFAASLSNDLTMYDALTSVLEYFLQYGGSPYLLGRVHFRDTKDLRALAIAIFIGGLAYILPCLFEIRMSPVLREKIYGIGAGGNTSRLGGFRPVVFLSNGIELGMWMTAATAVGYVLWLSKSVKNIRGYPVSWLLTTLLIVTIFCRSAGALTILAVGASAIYLTRRIPRKAWILALVLFLPPYEAARITDVVPTDAITNLITEYVDANRAQSFQFRIDNENLYINKAIQRIAFGWGGYNRHQVYADDGRILTINDSKWIITFAITGLFGLASWNLFMFMPACMLAIRTRVRDWLLPELAPATALVLVGAMFGLDDLVNHMENPIYTLGIGAVVSVMGSFRANRRTTTGPSTSVGTASSLPLPESEVDHRLQLGWLESRLDEAVDDPSRHVDLARGLESFARHLAAGGQIGDAEEVWHRAIEIWDGLTARFPAEPTILLHAAEARNDLAWLLASRPEATRDEADRALNWAHEAVRIVPESATFRNTLAMAFHRYGSWSSVLQTLDDEDDATLAGHNCLLRALAHHHLGDQAQARAWRDRARKTTSERVASLEYLQLASEADRLIVSSQVSRFALPRPDTISDTDKFGTTHPIDRDG